jgi:hypothetical protein
MVRHRLLARCVDATARRRDRNSDDGNLQVPRPDDMIHSRFRATTPPTVPTDFRSARILDAVERPRLLRLLGPRRALQHRERGWRNRERIGLEIRICQDPRGLADGLPARLLLLRNECQRWLLSGQTRARDQRQCGDTQANPRQRRETARSVHRHSPSRGLDLQFTGMKRRDQ